MRMKIWERLFFIIVGSVFCAIFTKAALCVHLNINTAYMYYVPAITSGVVPIFLSVSPIRKISLHISLAFGRSR